MKNKNIRLLSLLLCLALMLSLAPTSIFAETTDTGSTSSSTPSDENGVTGGEASAILEVGAESVLTLGEAFAEADGKTVRLTSDLTLTERADVASGTTVTLDLNGHKLTVTNTESNYALNNMGTLTVKDSVGGGSISARGIYNGYGDGANNSSSAMLVIESGTFNAMGNNGGAAVYNFGKTEIKGGTFTSIGGYSLNNQVGASMTVYEGVTATGGIYNNGATLVIDGGSISNNRSGAHTVYAWDSTVTVNGGSLHNYNASNATVYAAGTSTVSFTGGSVTIAGEGTSYLIDTQGTASYKILGGEFIGGIRVTSTASMTICGGTFANDYSNYDTTGSVVINGGCFVGEYAKSGLAKSANLAEGFVLDESGCVVTNGTYVAAIGAVSYESLQSAIDAAEDGDTVRLLADISISNGYGDGETVQITGKSITLDLSGHTLSQYVKDIGLSVAALKVAAGAELTLMDSDANGAGKLAACNTAVQLEGTLNFVSGAIAIEGSSKTDLDPAKGWAYGIWMYIRDGATSYPVFNMTGGKITVSAEMIEAHSANGYVNAIACGSGADGVTAAYDNAVVNVTGGSLPEGAPLYVGPNTSVTVPEGVEIIRPVAEVNGYQFTDLASAITYASNGDTVDLLTSTSSSAIIVIDKAITLNGNGNTVTSTAERAINVNCDGAVTIKSLNIVAQGERAINVIQKPVALTVSGVTAKADNYTVNIAKSAGAATVDITDSSLTGLNTVNVAAAGAAVTIKNSTVVCDDSSEAETYAALMLSPDATNGRITATDVAFVIKGDSVEASNNATGGEILIDGSADGVVVKVARIVYSNGTYYSFDTLADAITYASSGDTIELLADVKLDEHVSVDKTVTIDLNGCSITAADAFVYNNRGNDCLIDVAYGGSLTVKDSAEGGSIGDTADTRILTAIKVTNYGQTYTDSPAVLIIEGGYIGGYRYGICGNGSRDNTEITVNGGTVSGDRMGIYHPQDGILTINGGTVSGPTAIFFCAGSLVINDGNITGNGEKADYVSVTGTAQPTGDALVIDNRESASSGYGKVTVSVKGGSFTSLNASAVTSYANTKYEDVEAAVSGFISGGSFNTSISDELCSKGYLVAVSDDGIYTVLENVYFTFNGASIRYQLASGASNGTGFADIRFSYVFNEGFEFSEGSWGWSYMLGTSIEGEKLGSYYTEENRTNLVFTNVQFINFEKSISARLWFKTTVDGVEYTVYDNVQTRTTLYVVEKTAECTNEEYKDAAAYATALLAEYNEYLDKQAAEVTE